MADEKNKLVTGEIIKTTPAEGRPSQEDSPRGGVFIGTLNIMTEPARNFITEPLLGVYKSRYHGKFKRPKHVFAFDALLIAIGAVLACIAIYFGFIFKPFDPIQIQFTAAPKNPISGSEIVLNLSVSNMSESAMRNAVVVFKLPKEIVFTRSSLPLNRDDGRVMFGLIDSKTDVNERLVGKLSGQPNQDVRVFITLTFVDEKTKQIMTKNAETTFKIANSSVGAEFDLPASVIVGQTFNGEIRYYNRGNDTLKNIAIVPEWPNGFTLASSDPVVKAGEWKIKELVPGSENKISFIGTIDSSAVEADFSVNMNGSQDLVTVTLVDPQIKVLMNGTDKARLGDIIDLTATYKNDGDHTISSASIKTIVDDGINTVSVGNLNSTELKPGASGTFAIKIKIADILPDAIKNGSDVQLKVRAAVSGKLDNSDNVSIVSPAYGIRIASQLGLAAVARYWSESGDQLGRGPIPPAVGQVTRYWIFWSVKNTSGAVNNVRVSARLPANVGYTGKASVPFGDAPEYDPATRTLTWNVGDVSTWPGVTSAAVSAGFELSLIPTPDQVGTYPLLITNQKISGTDVATGLNLNGSSPDINSNLTFDPKAVGAGPVK